MKKRKNRNIETKKDRNSYSFGKTWRQVNDGRIFILGWTIPLRPCFAGFNVHIFLMLHWLKDTKWMLLPSIHQSFCHSLLIKYSICSDCNLFLALHYLLCGAHRQHFAPSNENTFFFWCWEVLDIPPVSSIHSPQPFDWLIGGVCGSGDLSYLSWLCSPRHDWCPGRWWWAAAPMILY